EEAHLGHLVDDVRRDAIAALDLLGARQEPFLDERSHAALAEPQVRGERRVHQAASARSSTSRRCFGMLSALPVAWSRITCTVDPIAQRSPSARSNAYSNTHDELRISPTRTRTSYS